MRAFGAPCSIDPVVTFVACIAVTTCCCRDFEMLGFGIIPGHGQVKLAGANVSLCGPHEAATYAAQSLLSAPEFEIYMLLNFTEVKLTHLVVHRIQSSALQSKGGTIRNGTL